MTRAPDRTRGLISQYRATAGSGDIGIAGDGHTAPFIRSRHDKDAVTVRRLDDLCAALGLDGSAVDGQLFFRIDAAVSFSPFAALGLDDTAVNGHFVRSDAVTGYGISADGLDVAAVDGEIAMDTNTVIT